MTTSEKIREIAGSVGKDPVRSIRYLQEHGYLTRVLRGIFYVNSESERETGALDRSIYEIVAEALAVKGVRNWYLALETALRINGLTHEHFAVNFIITDSYRTTKSIRIADMRFRFLRRSRGHFSSGILKRYDLKYSDKEKTILDLVYKRYLDSGDARSAAYPLVEYRDRLDAEKVLAYSRDYPAKVRELVVETL